MKREEYERMQKNVVGTILINSRYLVRLIGEYPAKIWELIIKDLSPSREYIKIQLDSQYKGWVHIDDFFNTLEFLEKLQNYHN